MPNNLRELHDLLERTSATHRKNLAELINASLGSSPESLCDQACFLRSGAIGQVFDKRDYKQLVTDIADHYKIDWMPLVSGRSWHDLTSREIEAAVVDHLDGAIPEEDRQSHIPFSEELKAFFLILISRRLPVLLPFRGVVKTVVDAVFNLQSTDWRRLVSLVVYVNRAIRPALGED